MDEKLKPWMFKVGLVPDISNPVPLAGVDQYIHSDYGIYFYCDEESTENGLPPIKIDGRPMFEEDDIEKFTDTEGLEYAYLIDRTITYWLNPPTERTPPGIYTTRNIAPFVPLGKFLVKFIHAILGYDYFRKFREKFYVMHHSGFKSKKIK
jgi:hypothetical protein